MKTETEVREESVAWVVAVEEQAASAQLGGKARSLVQLAALGLKTPVAFVVTDALFRHLVARVGEESAETDRPGARELQDDEDAERALAAIASHALPASFSRALGEALEALDDDDGENRTGDARPRFAVRSSFADEDDPRALAAGVYASELPVAKGEVAAAVRRVLASALSPAARAYARRVGRPVGVAPVAVLIHRYVEAQVRGSVAFSPRLGEERPRIEVTDEHQGGGAAASAKAPADVPACVLLSAAVRERLHQAAAEVAGVHGSADLEWASGDDDVVFLQSRPDTRTIFSSSRPRLVASPGDSIERAAEIEQGHWGLEVGDASLVWDAAHNPGPLSPAQAGLVAWVEERCRLPFRLRVVRGYLFYAERDTGRVHAERDTGRVYAERDTGRVYAERDTGRVYAERDTGRVHAERDTGRAVGLQSADDASRFWRKLEATLVPRLEAAAGAAGSVGVHDALTAALALYAEGYQAIFGTLQPWLARARAELRAFLNDHGGQEGAAVDGLMKDLLSGVLSLATERHDRAVAWACADEGPAREEARAAYLAKFGDESREWDVASPTWRERELSWRSLRPRPSPSASRPARGPSLGDGPRAAVALQVSAGLSPERRAVFEGLLSAARVAVALGEADDALFARLQACLRHALLSLGQALQAHGALPAAEDVFFLPWPEGLAHARELAGGVLSPDSGARLGRWAVEGRREWEAARKDAPPASWALPLALRTSGASSRLTGSEVEEMGVGFVAPASVWRGIPASPGRVVGRVVLQGDPLVDRANDLEPRIWVAATILPTELPLIEAAALVTETGGPLGHVAAQARERGLPAVVSLASATRVLKTDEWVMVDGDRGWVIALGPVRPAGW